MGSNTGSPAGGEANATGAGASVRTNGEAAWVNRGSTGASAGGAGFGSLTAPGWYPPRGGFKPTLIVLVLVRVVRLVGVAVAVVGVLLLRLTVVLGALLVLLVALPDRCRLRGLEAMDHDAAGQERKDHHAHDQDQAGHTYTADRIPHHVTKGQRGSAKNQSPPNLTIVWSNPLP